MGICYQIHISTLIVKLMRCISHMAGNANNSQLGKVVARKQNANRSTVWQQKSLMLQAQVADTTLCTITGWG